MRYFFLLLCLSLTSHATFANGDPVLGKQKAQSCVFCHSTDGKATQSSYPNLNNQTREYLFNSMKAYQLDQRSGPMADMMKAQLKRLNDQDMRDIAAFYASSN